ncbi:hypothetical protein Hanom_Chr13g01216371 [Helianthus anomalus]
MFQEELLISLRIVDSGVSMHKIGDIRLRNIVISRKMLLPLMEREERNRKEEEYVDEESAKIWLLWFLIGSSGKIQMKGVRMPWHGLNNRTLLLKRKTKTFAGTMWKTSRNRRCLILLL